MEEYEDYHFPIYMKLTGILIFENCKSHIMLIMYNTNVGSFVEKTVIFLIA